MTSANQNTILDTYVRQSQLLTERFVPFGAATLWRKVKDGSFPSPVRISEGVVAWKVRDILEWQQAQTELAGSRK